MMKGFRAQGRGDKGWCQSQPCASECSSGGGGKRGWLCPKTQHWMRSFPPLLGILAARSKGGWLVLPDFSSLPARKENSWEGSLGLVPLLWGDGGAASWRGRRNHGKLLPSLCPPSRPISFITEYPELEETHKAHPAQLLTSSSPHL